jgi:putative ribosome biogenesis GTPase RsgA
VPDADRAVGDVTGVGKGRHTSSSAVALELPGGGTVIDTPGVRSFGLGAVTPERVLAAFPDLAEAAAACPPGCDHLEGTPGCALDAEVGSGGASAARLDSLRRLLVALSAQDEQGAERAGRARARGGPGATSPRGRARRRRRAGRRRPGRCGAA